MESEIVKLGLQQGIWAVLFIFLLFYVLKTSGEREQKLIEALKDLKHVKDGVDRIEKRLDRDGGG